MSNQNKPKIKMCPVTSCDRCITDMKVVKDWIHPETNCAYGDDCYLHCSVRKRAERRNKPRVQELAHLIIKEVSKDSEEVDLNQVRVWAGELQELVGDAK